MNPALARRTIETLRGLPVAEADRALWDMHSESWHAIAAELGIRLPLHGGDKPALILMALGFGRQPASPSPAGMTSHATRRRLRRPSASVSAAI